MKILSIKKVIFINVELANKAYIYLLTALEFTIESTIELSIETDPFAYNTAIIIVL